MVSSPPKLRRSFTILTLSTLAVFGALVFGLTAKLREQPHREVLQREAKSIQAVAQMQISSIHARLTKLGVEVSTPEIFGAVLESSRLSGVLAVQLFDATGTLRESLPAVGSDPAATQAWWQRPLRKPDARFHRQGSLEEVFGLDSSTADPTPTPLLEIVVPLSAPDDGHSLGVARYWIEGTAIEAEFAAMDARLLTQAAVAFAAGALAFVLLLQWTYRRLAQAQQQLIEQSADLARANHELDFAAKTGALGAISAHLVHGLKNPLAGLEGFVAEIAASENGATRGEAQQTAIETARRLRALVNDVVGVLRDETAGSADYPVPLREAVAAIEARTISQASAAGVNLRIAITTEATLKARTANLAGLVLANLLANAIEASPPGSTLRLDAQGTGRDVEFTVSDSGPGLPEIVQTSLFRPVSSTKPGGGGMGLAISARLARHAGGELTLVRTDSSGTVFRLRVPAAQP